MKPRNRGIIYILIAAFLWSTGGLGIKMVNAPPLFIATGRCLVAGIVFMPFIKIRRITLSWDLFGLLISFTLTVSAFVTATKWTTSANAIAIQSTAPLWLFLFGIVRHKKVNIRKLVPVGLILAGIILFLLEPVKGISYLGNLVALVSGMSFAAVFYFMGRPHQQSNKGMISLCNLFSAVVLTLFVPVRQVLPGLAFKDIAILVFLGSVQIGLAYLFLMKGLETVAPLEASIAALLELVLNPIWVYLTIGEVPTIYGLMGAIAILFGVLTDNLTNKKESLPDKSREFQNSGPGEPSIIHNK